MKAFALLTIAACGAAARPAPLANTPPRTDAYLVWSVSASGEASTRWLDPDGRVVGVAPGIVIAIGDELWRLSTRELDVTLRTCEQLDHAPHAAPAGVRSHGALPILTRVDGGGDIPLARPVADEGVSELDWGSTILAGLGPYLFVEDAASMFACGAHGSRAVTAHVVDLDRRAQRAPFAADPALRDPALAERARAALPATDDGFDDTLHVADVVPAWTHGALAARYLIWRDACYACTSGDWSDYTTSAWIDGAPPAAIASLPAVPRAIAAQLGGDRVGVSWGHAGAGWRRVFRPR